MKNKKILKIASMIVCLTITFSSGTLAEAKENTTGECIDLSESHCVDNIEEYLGMLNSGLITPGNTTITTYEAETWEKNMITPFGLVGEPSKSCSNIFGHKWTSWGSWYELNRIHKTVGNCLSVIQRERDCTRTYCGATQKETDNVWITSCTH